MTCACVLVCIYEPADSRIIIPALQVVEPRLAVIIVSAIAQGVGVCHSAGGGGDIAVGVIGVGGYNGVADAVHQVDDVTLEVRDVEVLGAIVGHAVRCTVGVIGEIYGGAAKGLPEEAAAGVGVGVLDAVYGFGGADAVLVVGVADGGACLAGAGELAAIAPGEGPAVAIIVAHRVATDGCAGDRIGGAVIGLALVGNTLVIVGRQQILPAGVFIGIGVGTQIPIYDVEPAGSQDISRRIIGIGIPDTTFLEPVRFQELALIVILVGELREAVFQLASDVSVCGISRAC